LPIDIATGLLYIKNMNDKYYKTNDLALATALQVVYEPARSIDKTNRSQPEFIFRNSKKLQDYVNKFWRKELLVDPLSYSNELKNIKTRIYE